MIRDRCAARLHALLSIYDDLTPVRCVSSSYVLDRRSLRVRATRDPCNGTVTASPAYCALGKNYGKNFMYEARGATLPTTALCTQDTRVKYPVRCVRTLTNTGDPQTSHPLQP